MIVTRLSILICLLASASAGSASIFRTGKTYPSGESPVAAAVQDFNNDGISDIVSANQTGANVSIFLGNGDGTFGVANTFSVGAGAIEVASADLNGDGNADLVVTDGIKSAYVVLGNGDGTFGAPTRITLENDPQGIAIGDLNADGIVDLAVAIVGAQFSSLGEAAVLLGNGDGSFAAPVYYPLTQNGSRLVATDLNNDGKLDLAVAIQRFSTPRNALAVLLGNGDGTFQPAVTSVSGNGTDIAAEDFNSDGKMDLALAVSGSVEVVLGNGDGTFQSATTYATGLSGTIRAADFNGDAAPDLVVGGNGAAILLGDGSGGFGSAVVYGAGETFARVGYFNNDGIPDIVANSGSSEIEVTFGRARGALVAPLRYPWGTNGFDLADFDGDGVADAVWAGGFILNFVHGVGDGTLAGAIPFATLPEQPQFLVAADLNNDGKEDILALPYSGTIIYEILGNGDGTFQPAVAIITPIGSFDGFEAAVADLNHDGKTDLALTDAASTLLILLGNGDGTFQPGTAYRTLGTVQQPTLADFNHDGNLDLALSHAFSSKVSIYLGNGDGTFALSGTVSSKDVVYLAVGDLNRDGNPDLVAAGGYLVNVFLGNGDGTFQPPETAYSNYGPVEVADLDRDGRPDIALSVGSELIVLHGQGDGTFRQTIAFPTGSQFAGFFVLRDLNGDKTPEAVMSSGTVFLNTSRR